FGAGEDEEAFGVAAHAGGEVVELEEGGQLVGFAGVAFEVVEEGELTVEKALVAASEVDVEVADALPEEHRLLFGDGDRARLDVREGFGQRADLVVGFDADGGQRVELVG